MQRKLWHLCLLLLGVTMVTPLGLRAVIPQLDSQLVYKLRKDDERREEKKEKRFYDRDHKDYHDWDDREERAYRHWLEEERHEKYREFAKLERKRQAEYWKWRHEHPEGDWDRR